MDVLLYLMLSEDEHKSAALHQLLRVRPRPTVAQPSCLNGHYVIFAGCDGETGVCQGIPNSVPTGLLKCYNHFSGKPKGHVISPALMVHPVARPRTMP